MYRLRVNGCPLIYQKTDKHMYLAYSDDSGCFYFSRLPSMAAYFRNVHDLMITYEATIKGYEALTKFDISIEKVPTKERDLHDNAHLFNDYY